MNTIQGIQMIGTQRSGSNLLRVMLDGIREIAAPHPPHILQRFLPLLPKYGDLTDQSNFYRLAQDVCELVTVNPVPWEGITIRADEVVAACRQQTLYELFRVIYESAARQTGASFWLCKSMKNMLYAEGIESTGISPYYIYLYRDGRDVALSFKKAIVGEKHIYALAENWKKDQEAALRLKDRTAADHFFMLNYETLIASPEKVMRQLCDFLHLPYSDRVMDYYKSRESENTAVAGKMWANVTKPILKDNTKKFLRELSSEDIAIFESVAGDLLQQLDPKDIKWLERFHQLNQKVERIVTITYLTMVKIDKKLTHLSDRYEACWTDIDALCPLAFDHNQIIGEALWFVRQYVQTQPAALFDLLPKRFTAAELRTLYETIYDRKFDVRNFHKRIAQMKYVLPLEEFQTGVAHRAARYYKFDRKLYNKLHGMGKSFSPDEHNEIY